MQHCRLGHPKRWPKSDGGLAELEHVPPDYNLGGFPKRFGVASLSALIRLWGLRLCRNRCPVTCVSELSKRCKRERRDVRRPNALKSVPALRSNGCSGGAIMAC